MSDDLNRWLAGIISATVGAVAIAGSIAAAAELTGKPRIIDGATLMIGSQPIHLFGINAPQGRQMCTRDGKPWRCGEEATDALAFELAEHWVTCTPRSVGRDTPIQAVCVAGDHDIGERMVRQGWARADRRASPDYVAAEEAARTARVGLWRGEFTLPTP